jgi:hypothetical protein
MRGFTWQTVSMGHGWMRSMHTVHCLLEWEASIDATVAFVYDPASVRTPGSSSVADNNLASE